MTFRMGKTLAAALLCAAALTGAASAAYTDTAGHWAEGAIDRWSGEYGILRGYEDGSFRPDDTITRGAFAGILDRFLRYQAEAAPDTFSNPEAQRRRGLSRQQRQGPHLPRHHPPAGGDHDRPGLRPGGDRGGHPL